MTKFYVISPVNFETGGVELLHQLVYKLNKIKKNCAVIYYYNFTSSTDDNPTPKTYLKYTKGEYVTEIDDNENNVLISPEIFTKDILKYKNIRIAIWWLSVDNYYISIGKKRNFKEFKKGKKYLIYKLLNYLNISPSYDFNLFRKNIFRNKTIALHAYQSEYARLFLKKKNCKPKLPLSDFLNATFFQGEIPKQNRNNVILYNPKKGFEVIKKLMEYMPNYKWIALENFTPVEMKDLMKKSKIYVDFGNHPGKDRIPREAAINGCVVVTNKKGSAGNSIDVLLLKDYKIDTPLDSKDIFVALVSDIFSNFEKHFINFNVYRNQIKNEESLFEKEIFNFFNFFK